MKYMLLCYDNEKHWQDAGPDVHEPPLQEAIALTHEIAAKGQFIDCSPLEWSNSAVSVRVRDGKPVVTDGPFAETREVLGGYYIVDVENLDDAIRLAERHPAARVGTVEIRPLMELPGWPST